MKACLSCLMMLLLPIAFSCHPKPNKKDTFERGFSTYKTDSITAKSPGEKDEIFYGILTPVEICSIFDRLGVPYNKSTLNPISNMAMYLSSSKAAINTGIYGVDFGYLKVFGVGQELIGYMGTIRELSNVLGIPDSYFIEPVNRIRSDISDNDTITAIMNKAFHRMEDYLRNSGRESTAGSMIMGGWVEAMYIATQLVYDPSNPDQEVVQKIAEQKYTLTSLISLLKNYYNDPVVVYYTKKLRFLKNYFDTFDIYFKKGDLEIDTVKKVFRSTGSEMSVTVETLNNIRDYVSSLRREMVTP